MKKALPFVAAMLVFCSTAVMAGEFPKIGAPAPTVNLKNQEGKSVNLADFHGKWVVLYFYPKDFTSGCTLEAHNFQRDLAKYEKRNAVIVGVSVDSTESHKKFCAKESLHFQLLSDPQGKVATEYNSLGEYKGKPMCHRNTFLVNPKGDVVKIFSPVHPANHSEEVLAALDELQKK